MNVDYNMALSKKIYGFSSPFPIEIDTTREYLSISLLSSPINHIPTVGETYLQTSPRNHISPPYSPYPQVQYPHGRPSLPGP